MNDKIQQAIIEENRIKRKELHEQRHKQFKSLVDEHQIDMVSLKRKINHDISIERLTDFYNGTEPITREGTYNRLMKAIDLIVDKKPKYEILSKANIYTIQRHGNLFLNRKHKKNIDEIKSFLMGLGVDCRVIRTNDKDLILEDKKVFKTQFAEGKVI